MLTEMMLPSNNQRNEMFSASHRGAALTSTSRILFSYEISDDLQRRRVEVLERRYGGRERAHEAATRIQRAFREWRLNTRFQQMTTRSDGRPTLPLNLQAMHSHGSLPPYDNDWSASKIQRIPPPVEDSQQNNANRTNALRLKYTPATSLIAQLRADRAGLSSASSLVDEPTSNALRFRSGARSPPSPAPPSRQSRMFESLMSPRLVARRFVSGNGSSPSPSPSPSCALSPLPPPPPLLSSHHTPSASSLNALSSLPPPAIIDGGLMTSTAPIVWVPRTSIPYSSAGPTAPSLAHHHTNSLPRFDRSDRREQSHHSDGHSSASSRSLLPRSDLERKRQYRVALNFFNKNPARGVHLLTTLGFVDDNPESLAKLLFGRRGLSKQMIGEFLGVHASPFHTYVLDYFISQIDVRGQEVDGALRRVLSYFRLPGEAQKIERIMQTFSSHYARCNPLRAASFAGGADTIFILAFAVIMLNTDLHSRSIRNTQRMSKDDFIKNLNGVDAGVNMDREMLSGIYDRIKSNEFRHGEDHVTQVQQLDRDLLGKDKPRLAETHRRLVCYCRLHHIFDIHKRQPPTAHERDVFLFNDIIMVAKGVSRKKKSGNQYMIRAYSPLLGARVELFQRGCYENGISIECQNGAHILLNAKNYEDRMRFVTDVRESILECAQMEAMRIELELGKQQTTTATGSANGKAAPLILPGPTPVVNVPRHYGLPDHANGGSVRSDSQRDSGLPDGVTEEGVYGIASTRGEEADSTASSSGASGSTDHGAVSGGGLVVLNRAVGLGGVANGSRSFSRRLSFNSLDSGVVEENFDSAAL